MIGAATPKPILPAPNDLVLWAGWMMAAATLAVILLVAVLVTRKAAWHVGYQLGRFKK